MHPDPQRGHDAVRGRPHHAGVRGRGQRAHSGAGSCWRGPSGTWSGSWLAYWAGDDGRAAADRPVRPLPADPAPRGGPGPRLVRAARRGQPSSSRACCPWCAPSSRCRRASPRCRSGRFTLYTLLGCLPWCLALALIGAALGDRWTRAEEYIRELRLADRRGHPRRRRGHHRESPLEERARRRRGARCRRGGTPASTSERHEEASRRGRAATLEVRPASSSSSPCSPTFSNPTRWYIIRDRLCTATDSDSVR